MDVTIVDRRQLPERRAEVRETHPPALSAIDYGAMALLIVGGLNWALVGLFDFDLVSIFFSAGSPATRLVYVLFGIAALYATWLVARIGAGKS
jgi:uncharacterized membrane protein YuzA (DUF378 family)